MPPRAQFRVRPVNEPASDQQRARGISGAEALAAYLVVPGPAQLADGSGGVSLERADTGHVDQAIIVSTRRQDLLGS